MKTCEKLRCVANVDRSCAVETCRGELRSTGRKSQDAEYAAKEYQVFRSFIDFLENENEN